MSVPKPIQSPRFSFDDYQHWPEGERWELIDGVAFNMAPAPNTRHQTVAGNFFAMLHSRLRGKACTPFTAPTDVKFSEEDVVQPDLLVVCDPTKITPGYIDGAPDLVVEVLSPSTATRDLQEKFALYQRGGVREYLVVNPVENYLHRFQRDEGGQFAPPEFFPGNTLLPLVSLAGLEIPLWEIFDLPIPDAPITGPIRPSKGPEQWR